MQPAFRFTLAQLEVVPGDPERNVARMEEILAAEAARGVDLVVFPEMAVGGYLVGDLWLDADWCGWLMTFNERLRRASAEHGVAVLYGNVFLPEDDSVNKDGRRRKFNAAYLYHRGGPVPRAAAAGEFSLRGVPDGVQPKTLLPNYRFFDDERYFLSFADACADEGVDLEAACLPFLLPWGGDDQPPLRLGVQVCEDLWCADYRRRGRALNTARYLKAHGAEAIVNVSSSPWTYGKNDARDRRIAFLQGDGAAMPFLYVNRVGAENCGDNVIVYDGGTTAYGADGSLRALGATDYREDVVRVSLVRREDGEVGMAENTPLTRVPGERIARKHEAVRRGLRHVTVMTGLAEPKWVIGLSGGVDSAVSAALLVDAFGPESLVCLTMPSRHTSEATLANARHVADALGVPLFTAPIDPVVDAARAAIDAVTGAASPEGGGLAHENEQARLRGSVFLAGVGARLGRLFPNNGNKLETALGYSTLYGDVDGAIAPLCDLMKTEVVELAHHLNERVFGREVIPRNLLPDALWRFGEGGVEPTAELRGKQVDPMRFGYHDALLEAVTDYRKTNPETVAHWYLAGTLHEHLGVPAELLQRWHLDDPKTFVEDLEWFFGQVRRNVFKRVQSPPIIIVSKSAYGYDIRESLGAERWTAGYAEQRAKILAGSGYRPSVTKPLEEAPPVAAV